MKIIAWMLVVLSFSIAIFIIAYTLTIGSTTVTKKLSESTKSNDPLEHDLIQGNFRIGDMRYYDRVAVLQALNSSDITDRCMIDEEMEILIIDIITSDDRIPDRCEIFSDDLYADNFEIIPYPCHPSCSEKEFIYSATIDDQDIYEPHEIRICCEGECHTSEIGAICTKHKKE